MNFRYEPMLEIAKHSKQNGICQNDIAKNQIISVKYLDIIISPLLCKIIMG